MDTAASRRTSTGRFIGLAPATIAIIAALAAATPAVASAGTYKGGGKGALKDTIKLRASTSKVLSYDVNVETLCGKVNEGGSQTVVWPVTPNAGEAPLTIGTNGSFSGKQHQSTTIPAIHGVTTEPAPGTYSFSISGKLNQAKRKIEGHVSLKIETSTGYFCTVSNSPFTAKKQ